MTRPFVCDKCGEQTEQGYTVGCAGGLQNPTMFVPSLEGVVLHICDDCWPESNDPSFVDRVIGIVSGTIEQEE